MEQSCGTCSHWRKQANSAQIGVPQGTCRVRAPSPVAVVASNPFGKPVTMIQPFFPQMAADDPGCSEYSEKKEQT